MPAFEKEIVYITHFIRKLRGGSQPILAQASDGHTYVVKFGNNLQGPNLLFNESVGSELYRAWGLPVPEWRPVVVSKDFLDNNPGCWMETPEGRLRPNSGLCFGSRFLGQNGKRLHEILPRTSFERVRTPASFWLAWLIDVCAEHVDNRQALFTENTDGWLNVHFIDFGHFFGGPKADLRKNFRASRFLDLRIYAKLSSEAFLQFKDAAHAWNTDTFWKRLEAIPADWRYASSLGSFERCLERLASPLLVQSVLDTIVNDIEQRRESGIAENERRPLGEILRLGVQGAGLEWNLVHNPIGA